MSPDPYDAIVVGARCAGSPTAMLLAGKGYRVLVVDRASFPSDTMSTHVLHPPGVAAEHYHERPPILCGYYSYWSGLPVDGRFEVYARPGRGWAVAPTHDDQTLVVVGWPVAELEANRHDVEGQYLAMFDLAPEFA